MPKYKVWFTQYYSYEVEAEDEDTAFEEAHEEFRSDMCYPVARTCYDEVEIEEMEEEE